MYHLRVTLNLTSDIVLKNNPAWSISLLLFEGGISISLCRSVNASWDGGVSHTIFLSL